MRSFKCVSVVAAALLAYATVFAQSGDFETSGRVLVGGTPFQGATVTYTSIARRLSWDFSRADGTFGVNVSVKQPVGQNPKVIMPSEGPVTMDIFDMSGKKVETVSGKLDKGTYFLQPLPAKLAQTMYVLKIKAGGQVTYQKMLNTGVKTAGYTVALSSSNDPVVMAKKLADADTVRIGRTGYTPVFVHIASYGVNVGDQTLTAIDIEGLVNTVYSAMTQAQKNGAPAMPDFQDDNPSQCAADFCGLTFGGGGCFFGGGASKCRKHSRRLPNSRYGYQSENPDVFFI